MEKCSREERGRALTAAGDTDLRGIRKWRVVERKKEKKILQETEETPMGPQERR